MRPETRTPETVNEHLLDLYLREGRPVYRIYEPQTVSIVMGAGGNAEGDVFVSRAERDGVPILRRRGGGGTVVLSPGQVVLALVSEVASQFQNLHYFRLINNWFSLALSLLEIRGLEDKGISDLAFGGRKILGASLYRRRKLLFYQASLLVANDLTLFERYLRFPSRVPDYRCGRAHLEFCTTLRQEGFPVSVPQLMRSLEQVLREQLDRFR